jgi:3'(2'), 5'-bisphosphate nucleotidase
MSVIEEAVAIAVEAGKAIMEVYGRADFGTTVKDDRSPLTLADRAAHDRIVAALRDVATGLPILSEESESVPYETRARWGRFWLVDPLDGTKEFIKRNGEFTVNIALIEDGRPTLGVVHAPVLGRTYWGAAGQGAYRRDGDAAPVRIAAGDYRKTLRVVASRSHAGELMPRFLEELGSPECVSIGSSLKLCLVADGTANLYPRFGPTMEWDIAAAHAVVDGAGGSMTDIDGHPMRYDKPDLHNPWFVVCGNPPFPWSAAYATVAAEAKPA